MGSMIDFPISEDVEPEDDHEYLSDCSSSTLSLQKRKMSLDFSKLIDRSEHYFDGEANLQSKFCHNVSDPIQEEEDDDMFEDL